jgi:hypothetical protein
MSPTENPVDATFVSCEVCLKEIPKSEASVPEAVDYFVYFCGLDCYQKWNHKPLVENGKPLVTDVNDRASK